MAADPTTAVEGVEAAGGVQLEIPADVGYLSVVRMVVSTLAFSRRDLDDERVEDLVLAVSEAATNAIEAHAEVPADHPVVVVWREDDDNCRVEVVDRGGRADLAALPSEGPPTDPGRAALEGNLGVSLIRALVDDVNFETDDRGTAVSITMRCGPLPSPALD
ncbi:MAG TPA: ATP-binding protein [Acidimicrobiales bacterium]|nr:ATP-binding protein [Acidimicrobiales bacterium]